MSCRRPIVSDARPLANNVGLELRANPHPEVYSQQGLFRSPLARECLPPLSARPAALSPGRYLHEAVVLPHQAGQVCSCPVPSVPSTLDAGRRSTTEPCRASHWGHPNVHREVAVWAANCQVYARRSCIRRSGHSHSNFPEPRCRASKENQHAQAPFALLVCRESRNTSQTEKTCSRRCKASITKQG